MLDEVFTDVIVVINQITNIADEQIKKIDLASQVVDKNLQQFIINITQNIDQIRKMLTKKLVNIDIEKLKLDIEEATKTFINITSDLEILSLNTICQTKNLGKKKNIISYISYEIKRDSDRISLILNKIKSLFKDAYETTNTIIEVFDSLKSMELEDKKINIEEVETLQFNSDVSRIAEYSQFHDIFMQQLNKIEEVYLNIDWNKDGLFQRGQKLKFYESSIPILKEMVSDISITLEEILESLRDYLYNVNTDIQNMFSKVGITEHFHSKINKNRQLLLNNVLELKTKIKSFQKNIQKTAEYSKELLRFKKYFFNLTIATKIEVNRLGISSLQNLVGSMNNTYNNLIFLTKKILNTIKVWKELSEDLYLTIEESYSTILKYENKCIMNDLKELNNAINGVEEQLEDIKTLLTEKDYIKKVKLYKKQIINSLNEMIFFLEQDYKKNKSFLDEKKVNLEDFKLGYESVFVEKIKAHEEEISTIELF
ncbi:hypothetical protein JCM13304A_10760 [Desulfothermus okinawensis JCM 13304]